MSTSPICRQVGVGGGSWATAPELFIAPHSDFASLNGAASGRDYDTDTSDITMCGQCRLSAGYIRGVDENSILEYLVGLIKRYTIPDQKA